jgi:hypothetical protein
MDKHEKYMVGLIADLKAKGRRNEVDFLKREMIKEISEIGWILRLVGANVRILSFSRAHILYQPVIRTGVVEFDLGQPTMMPKILFKQWIMDSIDMEMANERERIREADAEEEGGEWR